MTEPAISGSFQVAFRIPSRASVPRRQISAGLQQGDFDEFCYLSAQDWFNHTPPEVLAKNFNTSPSTFEKVPKERLYIFRHRICRGRSLKSRRQTAEGTMLSMTSIHFRAQRRCNRAVSRAGGEVRIIDNTVFPVTDIAAAIVRLKPGGLRELHWHPLSDEWQYYISGNGPNDRLRLR